ncbi:hypothetical protein SNE40_017082 [Patella caerulea]|uniref:Uncharacterized protein n=1 Tax=Patella caerulea TaxID=87958 RepID=A0AAN8J9S2_PATCE
MNTLLVIMLVGAAIIGVTGHPHTEIDVFGEEELSQEEPFVDISVEPAYYKPFNFQWDQPYYQHDKCEETKQELSYLASELADVAFAISVLAEKRNQPQRYYSDERTNFPHYTEGRTHYLFPFDERNW